jgi:uncharacterized membrane protein YfcA
MIVLAAAAAVAGAGLQSVTGFGFALILGPPLVAALDPVAAVTLLLVLGVVLNLLVLAGDGRRPAVRWEDTVPMLLSALPGVAVGALLLREMSQPALELAVGITVLLGAGVTVHRRRRSRVVRRASSVPAGLVAGALTASTGVNGPPLVLWLHARGARPRELRDTLAVSFLALNLAGAAAIGLTTGAARALDVGALAVLAPSVVAGHALGRRLLARLDDTHLVHVTLMLVVAAGAAAVAAGIAHQT